jgi:hypothetical protein
MMFAVSATAGRQARLCRTHGKQRRDQSQTTQQQQRNGEKTAQKRTYAIGAVDEDSSCNDVMRVPYGNTRMRAQKFASIQEKQEGDWG